MSRILAIARSSIPVTHAFGKRVDDVFQGRVPMAPGEAAHTA